jgi:hypothetical protein
MSTPPTPFTTARIEGLYCSREANSFSTASADKLEIDEYGIVGDNRRYGPDTYSPFSQAGVRLPAFQVGRTIIARREISIMDVDSASQIADGLGLPEKDYGALGPERSTAVCRLLGANILLRMPDLGPSLYDIPNATDFGPADASGHLGGAALLITSYNNPCLRPFWSAVKALPGIVDRHSQDKYMKKAQANRGVVATPSACGVLAVGQEVAFFPRPVSKIHR